MTIDTNTENYVISSHVRFYRNVSGIPFPSKISKDDAEDINHHAIMTADSIWGEEKYTSVSLKEHFDNPYLFNTDYKTVSDNPNAERCLFTSPDGRTGILTNEAEHITVICDTDGFDIDTAYSNTCDIVNSLSGHMPFASNDTWGFLTSNPQFAGLGMSAALLVHLPGLCISPYFKTVKNKLDGLNISIRSFYADKKIPFGAMFYLTNKYTVGLTEEQSVTSIKNCISTVLDAEAESRSMLIGTKKALIQDTVWRSLATLACARRLNLAEFMVNISNVRLGSELSEIGISAFTVDEILKKGSDSYVKNYKLRYDINPDESIDTVRARIMREEFSPILKSIL